MSNILPFQHDFLLSKTPKIYFLTLTLAENIFFVPNVVHKNSLPNQGRKQTEIETQIYDTFDVFSYQDEKESLLWTNLA